VSGQASGPVRRVRVERRDRKVSGQRGCRRRLEGGCLQLRLRVRAGLGVGMAGVVEGGVLVPAGEAGSPASRDLSGWSAAAARLANPPITLWACSA
jgi:hypothetical protein